MIGIYILFQIFGIIRHDVDREEYRLLGAQPEFDCVGRYSTIRNPNDYATGVLIAPDWVLTAAHFVEDSSTWNFKGKFYNSKKIVKHPKLIPGASETQWEGYDLALVQLESPVADVIPAVRHKARAEVGALVTKVGYGYAGDGLHGLSKPPFAVKLAGNNIIDLAGGTYNGRRFSKDVLVCDFDSPITDSSNRFGSATPVALEIGGSKGDSGGGAFIEYQGKLELVGIVSGGLNRQITYGSMIALARVSSANAWIEAVVSMSSYNEDEKREFD